jgi:GNAT superfamily N-acetyltransferase
VITRQLTRDEIDLLHRIDRREYIANIYRLEAGELVLEAHDFDVPGWPPGHEESTIPRALAALDRGGKAWAALDGDLVAGAAVVDVKLVGASKDLIQLEWLHVSRDYRRSGLGSMFIDKACAMVREQGAAGLYISATPSENTVNFYRGRGATLVAEPDPELFALEPEDIHLELRI